MFFPGASAIYFPENKINKSFAHNKAYLLYLTGVL
jgi:hypothetical protein